MAVFFFTGWIHNDIQTDMSDYAFKINTSIYLYGLRAKCLLQSREGMM